MNSPDETPISTAPDTATASAPDPASIAAIAPAAPELSREQLLNENADLKKRLAEIDAQKTAQSADDKLIAARVAMGLSKPQATRAVQRQHDFDNSEYGKSVARRHEQRQSRLAAKH